VQERASSFRYLLAEFDILPMNWSELADELAERDASQNADNLIQLGEF
jgi:hypothetical protein